MTYASLFIGVLLVFLPARILASSSVARPPVVGPVAVAGVFVALAGAALALWCILTFALVGRGTPAPFDPPRRLVVTGPYRYVRNPMYLGATLVLVGAALVFRSRALLVYAGGFLAAMHVFAVGYEEVALARLFGQDYAAYRAAVPRWVPRVTRRAPRAGAP